MSRFMVHDTGKVEGVSTQKKSLYIVTVDEGMDEKDFKKILKCCIAL